MLTHAHSNTDWICSETEEAASTYLRRTSTFSSQPWPRCSSRAQLMSSNRPGLDTLYLCVGKALLLSIEIQTTPTPNPAHRWNKQDNFKHQLTNDTTWIYAWMLSKKGKKNIKMLTIVIAELWGTLTFFLYPFHSFLCFLCWSHYLIIRKICVINKNVPQRNGKQPGNIPRLSANTYSKNPIGSS